MEKIRKITNITKLVEDRITESYYSTTETILVEKKGCRQERQLNFLENNPKTMGARALESYRHYNKECLLTFEMVVEVCE